MLHRNDADGLIVITQPAHAWLSGEIARAWGNPRFGTVEPRAETCLGAEQHDCGWLEWERRPTLRSDTGLPHSFLDLPPEEHRRIWTRGPSLAAVQNPYAGLLVSLHGTGLYARYRSGPADSLTRAFLETQTACQEHLVNALRSHPRYALHVSKDALERNRRLVAAWDELSLFLCLAGSGVRAIRNVPAEEGEVDLEVTIAPGGRVQLDPWPFEHDRVALQVAGRRLGGTFTTVESMREALAAAPGADLRFDLHPASG